MVAPARAAVAPVSNFLSAITSPLRAPTAVAVDQSEFIYVTDSIDDRVFVFRPDGQLSQVLKGLERPLPIAVSSVGKIYIGNLNTGNVEVYGSDLKRLGKLGKGDGEFSKPAAIAIDGADRIYVVDGSAAVVKVFNSDGSFAFSFGAPGTGTGRFLTPTSIAINKARGEVIISDLAISGSGTSARVQIFGLDGTYKSRFDTRGAAGGAFLRPTGLTIDSENRIYVADAYQNLVGVYDEVGNYLGGVSGSEPLLTPVGMAYAPSTRRLLVASLRSGRVNSYSIDTVSNQMVANPSTFSFGPVPLGKRSPAQSLNISNIGQAPLVLGHAKVEGAFAASFAIVTDGCSHAVLSPGAACSIEVQYVPSVTGEASGLLAITSNDARNPEWRVAMSGSGTLPAYRVTVGKLGEGSVTGGEIVCGDLCTQSVAAGSTLHLTASANSGWHFDRWSGGCEKTEACSLRVDQDLLLTAVFARDGEIPVNPPNPAPDESETDPDPVQFGVHFEVGETAVDHNWKRVLFRRDYVEPVVVAQSASSNEADPATVQVRNIDADGFDIRLQEWEYLDGSHALETVGYMVVERGSHRLADGTRVEAGFVEGRRSERETRFAFQNDFRVAPVVVTAMTAYNEEQAVIVRLQGVDNTGFEFHLQEQEKSASSDTPGTIAYVAWEPSLGTLGGVDFEVGVDAGTTGHRFHAIDFGQYLATEPVFVAQVQTANERDTANLRWTEKSTSSVQVRVDEEQSRDKETRHRGETVGYMVFAVVASAAKDSDDDGLSDFDETYVYGSNPLVADTDGDGIDDFYEVDIWASAWSFDVDGDGQNYLLDPDSDNDSYLDGVELLNGTDMADPGSYPKAEDLLERGSATIGRDWTEIAFEDLFVDPVVVVKAATFDGSDAVGIQVRLDGANGFTARLVGGDANTVLEAEIQYLAIERGRHQLWTGALVEAGHFMATTVGRFQTVPFVSDFDVVPVVITGLVSANGENVASGQVRNVSKTGFDYRLRALRRAKNTVEHIAYIAWEPSQGVLGNLSFEVRNVFGVRAGGFGLLDFAERFTATPMFFAELQSHNDGINGLLIRNRAWYGVELKLDSSNTISGSADETVGFIAIE